MSDSKKSLPMIPFNKAHIAGKELYYIAEAVLKGELKGDGPFTKRCHEWFQSRFGVAKALLTHSCTGALEMAAILADIKEGDEVIMPSYTFTSTANAFLLRGAKLVFCDIREDTLNIDESLLPGLITEKTKVIVPVHYAGVGCDMESIMSIARANDILVIEDAAHAIMAKYKGQWLGTIGDINTFSFHETKNYSSGEGGALLLNNDNMAVRAEIIREKGTNRSQFFRGEVDKYSWVDVGSSYLPSEIVAAFLYGQLEQADVINNERLTIWNKYNQALKPFEDSGYLRLPIVPEDCEHNAHMFYILANSGVERDELLQHCRDSAIGAVFHYVPLHLSTMGEKLGYKEGDLPKTEELAGRILRLPLYCGLTEGEQNRVCASIAQFFLNRASTVGEVANY